MGPRWREGAIGEICLLGEPIVRYRDDEHRALATDQSTQILGLLLYHHDEPIPRDIVIEKIWERPYDDNDADANARLRPVLSKLRQEIESFGLEGLTLSADGPLTLTLPPEVDVDFLGLEAAFEALEKSDDPEARWILARKVIDGLEHRLLESCNVTPFLNDHREKLDEIRYHAALAAIEHAQGSEDSDRRTQAKQDAEAMIARWPEGEAPRSGLIQLHLEDGALGPAQIALDALRHNLGEAESVGRFQAELARRRWRHDKQMPLVLPVTEEEEKTLFIGHEKELNLLESDLQKVLDGEYRGVLLSGEKGIGKSRLARELGHIAHRRGCAVLSASALQPPSREDHPCQSLIDAVSGWIKQFGTDGMTGVRPTDVAEIARYAPELLELDDRAPDQRKAPFQEGLRAAIQRLLVAIGQLAPTVVLLDDIQAADRQTLHLLSALQATRPGGMMIVATGSPEVQSDLPFRLIPVPPLEPSEGRKLAAAVRGDDPGASEEALADDLGGNPFLIVNQTAPDRIEANFILPQLRSTDDEKGEAGHKILRLAALLGSPFELSVLRDAVEEDVESALSIAEEHKLIRPGKEPGTFEFEHSLIQEALLDGIQTFERGRLAHLLVAALDPTPESAVVRLRLLKEVARTRNVKSQAAAAALEAGQHARCLPNYEAAQTRCEEGLGLVGSDEVALRGHLLVLLGHTLWSLGKFGAARRRFVEAQQLAGLSPVVRAEAALGFGGRLGFAGASMDREYIEMLRRALDELPAKHKDLRLRLRAALASAMAFAPPTSDEKENREALCDRALTEAAQSKDPALKAELLSDLCWVAWRPDEPEARRDLAREFVEAADKSRDVSLRIEALIFRLASSLEDGDMVAVQRDMSRCKELADSSVQPHFEALVALLDGMRILLDGKPTAAAERAQNALAVGGREENPAVFELYGAQILLIRLLQGRVDKLRSASEAMTEAFPGLPGLRAGLGLIYAELDRPADAKRQLEEIAENDFAAVPRDVFWLITMEHVGRLAAKLQDKPLCEELLSILKPYAGRIAVAGGAVAVYGAVDRALGLLAGACGDDAGAVDSLSRAVEINERIGAHTINAFVMRELADALARVGGASREIGRLRRTSTRTAAKCNLALKPHGEALAFSNPSTPPGVLGGLKQRGAQSFSHRLRGMIEERSDEEIEQGHFGVRVLRRFMPRAFVPEAACGWTGEIEIEFEPPIGFRDKNPFWTFQIDRHRAQIFPRRAKEAKLFLAMSPATFFRLIAGIVNPVEAWLEGRASIKGDPAVAARLIEMFSGPTGMTDKTSPHEPEPSRP